MPLFLDLPPFLQAQETSFATVSGRVSAADRLPIAAATIRVQERLSGTVREGTSDSNGAFTLRTLPLGLAHLSISAKGYGTLERDIDVQPGMALQFTLGGAGDTAGSSGSAGFGTQQEHVEVTAVLEKQPSDVTMLSGGLPTIVNTVTAEEIEHTNVGRDVGDLLNRVPGVVIASLNQGDIGTGLKVRGFFTRSHGAEVATYIDGMPQNIPSAAVQGNGANDMSWLIPETIDRIEVIKGPFSALYGDENRAAAVNIITKDTSASRLTVNYGRFNTTQETGVFSGKLGRFQSLLAGTLFHTDGYRNNSNGTRGTIFAKETFLAKGGLWSLRGDYQGSNWNAPGFLSLAALKAGTVQPTDRDTSSPPLFGDANRTNFTFTRKPAEGEKGLYLTSFLERYNRRRAIGVNATTIGVESDARWISGGRAIENYNWKERYGLTAGVDLRSDYGSIINQQTLNSVPNGNYGFDENINLLTYGFFGQGQAKLLPSLKLIGGLRVDGFHYNIQNLKLPASSITYNMPVVTPRAGVAWSPSKLLTAYFNMGQGFRAPDQSEISPSGAAGRLGATGGGAVTNIDPPKITSYDYGVNAYLSPRWTLSAAGFYTLNNSEIAQISAYVFSPIGSTTRVGFEADARFQVTDNLNVYASLTDVTTARINNPLNNAGNLLSVPQYVPKAGAGYIFATPKGRVALNVDAFYYSKLPFFPGNITTLGFSKPYARYDLRGSYYIGHIELTGSAILQPYRFSSEAQFASGGGFALDPRPKWDGSFTGRYRF